MLRRRRAVCARSKRNLWRFFVANLWGLREPSFAEVTFKIGSDVEAVLMRMRYRKRAPKKSSALPIKSSAPDAPKTILCITTPENEPRQPRAIALGWRFFWAGRNCACGAVAFIFGGKNRPKKAVVKLPILQVDEAIQVQL